MTECLTVQILLYPIIYCRSACRYSSHNISRWGWRVLAKQQPLAGVWTERVNLRPVSFEILLRCCKSIYHLPKLNLTQQWWHIYLYEKGSVSIHIYYQIVTEYKFFFAFVRFAWATHKPFLPQSSHHRVKHFAAGLYLLDLASWISTVLNQHPLIMTARQRDLALQRCLTPPASCPTT